MRPEDVLLPTHSGVCCKPGGFYIDPTHPVDKAVITHAHAEIAKLLHSLVLFPERAHLVGAYPLGKAQRLIALLRKAGHEQTIYIHGAMERITRYYQGRGIDLGRIELARDADKTALAGAITLCPPSSLKEIWSR